MQVPQEIEELIMLKVNLLLLDADDIWKKFKLEKQINFMRENNHKFTHTSYEIIDENDKVLGKKNFENF